MRFRDVGGGVALPSSAYHRVTQVRGGRGPCRWNCKTSNPVGRPWLCRRPSANSVGQRATIFGRGSSLSPTRATRAPPAPLPTVHHAWSCLVFVGLRWSGRVSRERRYFPWMSSTEHVVASPAAAVLERRLSRTTPEKRKLPCGDSGSEGSETGSDGEWSGDDDPLSDHGREDEDEVEDEAVLRGRVRKVQQSLLRDFFSRRAVLAEDLRRVVERVTPSDLGYERGHGEQEM